MRAHTHTQTELLLLPSTNGTQTFVELLHVRKMVILCVHVYMDACMHIFACAVEREFYLLYVHFINLYTCTTKLVPVN